MKSAKDNFSANAKDYSSFRPQYPDSLYSFIYSHLTRFGAAWDCGTGNGQVAHRLAEKFEKVFATDISDEQLKNSIARENIIYDCSRAEKTIFPVRSFDLITVAQAIHWFDIEAFYQEVRRVAKPGGIVAAWGYGLLNVTPLIDTFILDFYENVVGEYWDAERKLVDEQYKTIPFPFKEIKTQEFQIVLQWTKIEFMNYLSTWSAVRNFIDKNQNNPVEKIESRLSLPWENEEKKKVRFPLFLRMGRIE